MPPPSVPRCVCATVATRAPGTERGGCTCSGLAGRVCALEMSWQPCGCRNPRVHGVRGVSLCREEVSFVHTGVHGASLGVRGRLRVPDSAACVGVQDASLLACCAALQGCKITVYKLGGSVPQCCCPLAFPPAPRPCLPVLASSYLAARAEERLIPMAPELFRGDFSPRPCHGCGAIRCSPVPKNGTCHHSPAREAGGCWKTLGSHSRTWRVLGVWDPAAGGGRLSGGGSSGRMVVCPSWHGGMAVVPPKPARTGSREGLRCAIGLLCRGGGEGLGRGALPLLCRAGTTGCAPFPSLRSCARLTPPTPCPSCRGEITINNTRNNAGSAVQSGEGGGADTRSCGWKA